MKIKRIISELMTAYVGSSAFLIMLLFVISLYLEFRAVPMNQEMPLDRVFSLVMTSNGVIVVALEGRLQMYDERGYFLCAVELDPPGGGPWRMTMEDDGSILVAGAKAGKATYYQEDGTIIKTIDDRDRQVFVRIEGASRISAMAANGDRSYAVEGLPFMWQIRRMSPSGQMTVLVNQPWSLRVMSSRVMAAIGGVILVPLLVILAIRQYLLGKGNSV